MDVGMVLTIAFYLVLVGGYCFVVAKVWRGESEFDGGDRPAFWPFSTALWRGAGRAIPILGASVLLLIGAGIASDLIGADSKYDDAAMSIGLLGLLGTVCLGFPVMYFNRPKLLVPPPWRDDPGAVEEWRSARARR
jgi:hypothetical protein